MTIDDRCGTSVFRGPVVAHGQAELVRLAGRFTIKGKLPDLAGTTSLHFFLRSRMGDNQSAIVKDVVADQAVEELSQLFAEICASLVRQRVNFGHGLRKSMGDLHVFSTQLLEELAVVIARYTERVPRLHHVPDDAQCINDSRATIHQIPDENGASSFGMAVRDMPPRIVTIDDRLSIAKCFQQLFQFIAAAVDVADDIERAMLIPPVIPQGDAFDRCRVDLFNAVHDKNVPESFPLQSLQ